MASAKSPQPAAAEEPETLPVIWIPPVDPGDAGGMGNSTERVIVPGTLHKSAEEARADGTAWARG
ncbi:hypothetical protein [Methylobacterium sp. J-092]|uniref:hypothetical protein n=1 Tax=Methylobacterium sp. J-092 TaxID=2836667 RepID=UPI001FB9BEE1|nr:hypothetical protein [Methylobacterium sp. J-092]MCJ2008213.1 hypothetical protein [Methylobacterium sp. J-092]